MIGAASGVSARPIPDVVVRPHEVAAALSPTGGVVLSGDWAGGGAIVADHPVQVSAGGSVDPFSAVTMPVLDTATARRGTVGGGWFGWFGFAAGRNRPPATDRLPDVHLALHPNVVRYDPATDSWWDEALLGVVSDAELEDRRRVLVAQLRAGAGRRFDPLALGAFTSASDRSAYMAGVERTIEHIRAGDIYQANVCLSLSAALPSTGPGPAAALHAALMRRLRPRFGALLRAGTGAVVSASPELFLRRRDRAVLSSPIKGTRPRPAPDEAARAEAATLRASEKDRAENVMIVDLVRNDLARVAATGSVAVPALLRLEAHPGVWHLVSDVRATLADGVGDPELLRATFPPGSVTGTPKLRALEVIDEVEPVARGVYTGALGFISPVAGLELSVAIRTFELVGDRVHLGVGAGITAGSDPREEWWECFDKASALVAAIGGRFDVAGHRRPLA